MSAKERKRPAQPVLSLNGEQVLAAYEHWMREREDLAGASLRN